MYNIFTGATEKCISFGEMEWLNIILGKSGKANKFTGEMGFLSCWELITITTFLQVWKVSLCCGLRYPCVVVGPIPIEEPKTLKAYTSTSHSLLYKISKDCWIKNINIKWIYMRQK